VHVGFAVRGGSGDWDILHDHRRVGTSVGLGAHAGSTQTGIESTTGAAAAVGQTVHWQYRGADSEGPVTAPHVYNNAPDRFWVVADRSTVAAGSPSCRHATLPPPQAPIALTPEVIGQMADHAASTFGDPSGGDAVSVVSSYRTLVNALFGAAVEDDSPVVALQIHGQFVAPATPASAHSPVVGTTLTLVVDSRRLQIADWALTTSIPDLSTLGHVTNIDQSTRGTAHAVAAT
jgi:hypothetical protein